MHRLSSLPVVASPRRARALLLTTYFKDVDQGQNLGTPGYSYEFVARLFRPLLERWGEVIEVRGPEQELDRAAETARRRGLEPLHVCFRAFQHACLTRHAPNIVVPAWGFPDVPDHAFDNECRHDWVATGNRCDLVIVGGPWTADVLVRAGIRAPIRVVPVPTPEEYFQVPAWDPEGPQLLDCPGYVLRAPDEGVGERRVPRTRPSPRGEHLLRDAARRVYQRRLRPLLPQRVETTITAAYRAGTLAWARGRTEFASVRPITLGGVVYTSFFNPSDGRKNWKDLLTGFLLGLHNQQDATLLLKLITSDITKTYEVFDLYRQLDLCHRSKVVIVTDFLSEEQMQQVARASTYYVQTSRAEGNCLPLMNYMAAGRPGLSPCHTALCDYFDDKVGLVVDSHPCPTSWPQDNRHRCRTSWHRLVWPSLTEQFRRSHDLAANDRQSYDHLAAAARGRMQAWAHPENVWPRLRQALDAVASATPRAGRDAQWRAVA
jgi:hypothetical protein